MKPLPIIAITATTRVTHERKGRTSWARVECGFRYVRAYGVCEYVRMLAVRARVCETLTRVLVVFLLPFFLLAQACAYAPVEVPAEGGQAIAQAPVQAAQALGVLRVCVPESLPARAGVLEGVAEWAHATRGWRAWELASTDCELTFELIERDTLCAHEHTACVHVSGLEVGMPTRVYMVRGQYEAIPRYVTLHEIGHAIGLGHVDGGVMAESVNEGDVLRAPPATIDSETIARLEWHLGVTFKKE